MKYIKRIILGCIIIFVFLYSMGFTFDIIYEACKDLKIKESAYKTYNYE